ncbi:uncharacterized protein LOC135485903 [Lineus longissimus]|uniref:uncharacterized protein LOC135485903 n=1 Tax=Lineus longissimus TaxID=88925 RepID=UPI00315D6A72
MRLDAINIEHQNKRKHQMDILDQHLEAVTTRPVTEEDGLRVAQWTKDLGWALADAGLLKAISKAYGGIAAEYKGDLIGYVCTARLNADLGICPVVIVKEEWRSKGVGKLLVRKATDAMGSRAIRIHSIEEVHTFYKQIDFSHRKGMWHRYMGDVTGFCESSAKPGKSFVKSGDISVEEFAAFEERKVFGLSKRRNIINEMSKFGDRYAVVCDGSITGVLLGHSAPLKDETCWYIDVLIANDAETAIGLVGFAGKDAQNECKTVFLCLPELHGDARSLIERLNLRYRMSGPVLFNKDLDIGHLDLDCVYAITPLM